MARIWHINRTDDQLTLSRQLPVQFDIEAETTMPTVLRGRLAHQIRQDMWRKLQSLRGFSPAVEITSIEGGLRVRAGGRVSANPFPKAKLEAQIQELLNSESHRSRWLASARSQEVT
ncbi:MAG: hypothetical protein ABJP33_15250 [Pseudoruegeria sp.]